MRKYMQNNMAKHLATKMKKIYSVSIIEMSWKNLLVYFLSYVCSFCEEYIVVDKVDLNDEDIEDITLVP
jgi:formylmethanofuran dehydrogenase subunit E